MRAFTPTKLSLYRFCELMGLNPIHVAGVQLDGNNGTGPNLQIAHCQQPWHQYEWMEADRVSREELARAIARAESDIEGQLGYRLLPAWEVDEWQQVAQPAAGELLALGFGNQRGMMATVNARWGRFVSGGIEARTLISAGVAIVWSDPDGDGYNERGQVAVATTVTDPCEIALYHPGHAGDGAWEIRPITVTIAAGVATIRFRRELAVAESISEGLPDAAGQYPVADGFDDADFLATVDVYRHYNDPSQQGTLMWEPLAGCTCLDGSCAVCTFNVQTACLHARNRDLSMLAYTPASWDATNQTYISNEPLLSRRPDVVRLWYRAGLRDETRTCPTLQMDPAWERTVAIYAAALLERAPCDCNLRPFEHWQADLAYQAGAEELAAYALAPGDLDCPFGTRRGAIHAWRRCLQPDAAYSTRSVVLA